MKLAPRTLVPILGTMAILGLFVAGWFRGLSPKPVPGAARSADRCEQVSPNHWRISKNARTEYFRDPGRLHRDLQLEPTPGAGRDTIKDLKVSKVTPGSPMDQAGFSVGDRIRQVNGRTVATLTRALNLSNEFQSNDRVAVQVEREGKLIDYQFDFE